MRKLSLDSLDTMSILSFDYLTEQPEFQGVKSTSTSITLPVRDFRRTNHQPSLYPDMSNLIVAATENEEDDSGQFQETKV